MTTARIARVNYEEGYRMEVCLQNGHEIIYNMEPKLTTARFGELAEWDVFISGKIADSGKVIRWNDRIEISLEEMMLCVADVL